MKTLAILLLAAIAAPIVTFIWGMSVGLNDGLALASDEATSDQIAQIQCGPRAWIAKRGGERRCLLINPDGSAITRAVFDNPIGAM